MNNFWLNRREMKYTSSWFVSTQPFTGSGFIYNGIFISTNLGLTTNYKGPTIVGSNSTYSWVK